MTASEDSEPVDKNLYQSAVGSLIYLSTCTRPDIAFAVSNVAKYCSRPSKKHWTSVKRILRYLKATNDHGLFYCKTSEKVGYTDAGWAGDINYYRSTSGYVFKLGGAAISWKSQKQTSAVAMALSGTTQECNV